MSIPPPEETAELWLWLKVTCVAVSVLWTALMASVGLLWKTLVSKEELAQVRDEIMQHDQENDREMEQRLESNQLRLHRENQIMFREVRDDIKLLLRRPRGIGDRNDS